MPGNFDDIIRQMLGLNPDPSTRTVIGPPMQTPVAPPNILGPEYDNLPKQAGSGPLDAILPSSVPTNFTPSDAVDKAIEGAAQEYLARRK